MAASRRRHYEPIGADPWVVRSDAVPLDVSRMQKLRGDPHVRFFTAMAPRYTEGEAVVVWIPLDVANILVGVLRLVRARLAR